MSTFVGPPLAKDGLVMYVDASNAKSIKGKRSLIIWDNWTLGSGGATGYGQNGSTVENERVSGTDPWGNTNVVWETRPTGTADADGGWNTDWFNIDRSKLYRFSVWVKRTSSTTGGTFYLGMYANGDGSRRMDNNAVEGNAYWECSGTSRFNQNQWYLVVGHVYPSNTTNTGQHPDTGIYTTTGGKVMGINACNIGSGDIKWSNNSTQGIHRTYHYYCGDNTTRLQFFQPRVDLCDGNEPNITDLLNNAGSTWFDMSGNNHHITLGSGVTYSNTASGVLTFSKDANGFGRNTTMNLSGSNNTVISVVRKLSAGDAGRTITALNNNWLLAHHDNTYGDYYAEGWVNDVGSPASDTTWRMFTGTGNISTDVWQAYINNTLVVSNTNGSQGPNGWNLNSQYAQYSSCQIANLMAFNRVLSSTEIAQIFDSLRSRFGI
jgi:hypothetical protein